MSLFRLFFGVTGLVAHTWYVTCVDGATELLSGEMVIGSTVGEPILYPDGGDTCGTTITSSGVLYVIEGDGESLTVDTCSDETDFNSKISIYSGPDLSETGLTCIGGIDNIGTTFACIHSTTHPQLTIPTVDGTYYYILVHGSGTSSGTFELTAFLHLPAFDTIPLVYGLEHEGTCLTTGQPVLYPDGSNFCGTSITTSGVLHVIRGTGAPITVSTCSFDTSYDTKVSIYSGPDESGTGLTCITGQDDTGIFCSSSVWHTQILSVGTDSNLYYYILVHGYSYHTGRYQLEVSDGTNIATPVCGLVFDDDTTAQPTTEEPTAAPTPEPTAAPTSEPTTEPTPQPTPEPTTADPTLEPTAEPTMSPTKIFLEACDSDPCDCTDEDVDPFCKICHYPDVGCSQCKRGYFKLDYDYPCTHCKETFGPGCKFCQDFNGCGQCKRNYVRRYDEDLGAYCCFNCKELYGEGCKVCQQQGCGQCKRGYELITNEEGVRVCV